MADCMAAPPPPIPSPPPILLRFPLLPPPPLEGSATPLATKEPLFTGGAILRIVPPVKSGSLVAKGVALPCDGEGGRRGKRRMGGGEGMGGGGMGRVLEPVEHIDILNMPEFF